MKSRCLFLFAISLLFFILSHAQQSQDSLVKLSPRLQAIQNSMRLSEGNDSITLVLTVKDLKLFQQEIAFLKILSVYTPAQTILVSGRKKDLFHILKDDNIVFADVLRKPYEEITTGAPDLTTNKINYLHRRFPDVNGEAITISIKENRFDKEDIDLKGRWITGSNESPSASAHASIMATVIAGGGNSSPAAKGVAWGARVVSSDFSTLLPDADTIYRHHNISIQNHSYGVGIENFYGSDAVAFDISVVNNPSLVHVFSAGNAGTQVSAAGLYTGVRGFANLTGSFKMAKNVIVVGAVDSFGNVVSPSSKGPAFDGRIKPDLVAYGDGGSSGAAAVVSGTVAVLQQAYRKAAANAFPPASLIRAVLANSATDIGARHIDYTSGFGNLNAFKAMQTIEQKRYRVDRIAPNEKKTFEINVPPRATSLKITLSWTDTAAAVNAQKALVNDVDIRLRLPATDETWQPWVLNKFPDSDSLSAPAKRGIDTLNNIEQITINDPADGLYTFEVNGTSIKTTGQDFAFAYQVDTADSFQWTFPTKSDPVLSGRRTVLRWETTIDEKADLEYTVNGTDWQRIATGVDLTNEHYSWDVPLEDTLVQLRAVLKTTNRVYSSDSIILSQPVRLRVGYYCADSVLLYWNRTSAATQLYTLGDLYMQPLLRTSDTMVILHRQQHPSLYYATAPVIAGQEGSRSQTLNYQLQGVGCYFTNFLAQLQDNHAILSTQLGTTYSITEIQFQKLTPAGYRTIKSLRPLSTSLAYNDSSLTAGMNVYRAQIILQNGQLITSEPQTIYYFPKLPVIVFPNPGRQNEPIQIIVADRDEYTIQLFDILGRLVHEQKLTLDLQTISKFHLGKGVYLIKIMNNQGVRFTEKLIIY